MKRIMLIGKSGCGKPTFCQKIFGQEIKYKKTQSIEIVNRSAIDTPGEYIEHRMFLRALMMTGVDAETVLFFHAIDNDLFSFSPRITTMFNRPTIGVITKADLPHSEKRIQLLTDALNYAGASPVFVISSYTGEGIEELLDYIEKTDFRPIQGTFK